MSGAAAVLSGAEIGSALAVRMIRKHFDGIAACTQTRQTNSFLEALNGLFQAAKRRARGYAKLTTMRTVLFPIAGKLDFASINLHAAHPTQISTEPRIGKSNATA